MVECSEFKISADLKQDRSGTPVNTADTVVDARIESIRAGIADHDFVASAPGSLAGRLTGDLFGEMVSFEEGVLTCHERNPIDIIVGDDVSGRIPTLITHNVLRLAHAGGHIATVPRTTFIASGHINDSTVMDYFKVEQAWKDNISAHVAKLVGTLSMNNALVITETVSSGKSMKRIIDAFESAGIFAEYRLSTDWLYLTKGIIGEPSAVEFYRQAVGVEKQAPEPTTHRRSDYDGKSTKNLRVFIRDYAGALYKCMYNEEPPTAPYRPNYTSKILPR